MNRQHYTFGKLFAEPSFVEGVGSVLDLGNTLHNYNESQNPQEADTEALRNDWRAVGEDLQTSIMTYERTQRTAKSA